MTRLIAFGCSLTFGHGLSDCYVDGAPGPNPSKYAWPSLLGNELNVEAINKASPGSSNLKILNEVLNYDFLTDDIVVILWSFHDRDMLFDPIRNVDIGPWITDSIVKAYYQVHTDHDMAMKTMMTIHHCHLFLKLKGVKILHAIKHHHSFPFLKNFLNNDSVKWFDTPIFYFFNHKDLDVALDNKHPGPKTQLVMSKLLLHKLKQI